MRTEQVMDAVVTALTGLATTGSNVFRGRVYDLPDTALPGLAVSMGEDTIADELNGYYDWTLSVAIESKVEANTQVDTTLNTIRGEVHAALRADPTLGLSFVIDTKPSSAEAPDLSGEGAKPIGTQRLIYQVRYRTNEATL